jgi:hypothetical protein
MLRLAFGLIFQKKTLDVDAKSRTYEESGRLSLPE